MLEQRMDETADEFARRRHQEARRYHERARESYQFAPEPKDLYADYVTFDESYGVLRLTAFCSRPDCPDEIGEGPGLPVARLSMPYELFKRLFESWLQSDARRDAQGA